MGGILGRVGTHLFAVLGEKHSGEAGVERVCVDPAAYPIATVALGAELLADRVAIIQSVEESRDTSQQTFSRNLRLADLEHAGWGTRSRKSQHMKHTKTPSENRYNYTTHNYIPGC